MGATTVARSAARSAAKAAARPGRPPKVNRRDVVTAAIALADAEGLAAVTIRGVAARLGVAPMTLYGHVASADELVDLVVGATIVAAIDKQPTPFDDGRSALLAFAHGLRGLLLEHPAVLDAYRRRPIQDPTGVAVAEAVVAALVADGLDADAALTAYATVYAYVVGFVSLEARSVTVDPAVLPGHPTLERVAGRLADLFDPTVFDRGLAALIDSQGEPR